MAKPLSFFSSSILFLFVFIIYHKSCVPLVWFTYLDYPHLLFFIGLETMSGFSKAFGPRNACRLQSKAPVRAEGLEEEDNEEMKQFNSSFRWSKSGLRPPLICPGVHVYLHAPSRSESHVMARVRGLTRRTSSCSAFVKLTQQEVAAPSGRAASLCIAVFGEISPSTHFQEALANFVLLAALSWYLLGHNGRGEKAEIAPKTHITDQIPKNHPEKAFK